MLSVGIVGRESIIEGIALSWKMRKVMKLEFSPQMMLPVAISNSNVENMSCL